METSLTQKLVIIPLVLLVVYHIALRIRSQKGVATVTEAEKIIDGYDEIKLTSKSDIRTQLLTKMCQELVKNKICAEPNGTLALDQYVKIY